MGNGETTSRFTKVGNLWFVQERPLIVGAPDIPSLTDDQDINILINCPMQVQYKLIKYTERSANTFVK